jgi:hypothetical protein
MNLSVEHVLLFLVGAFLVWHIKGKCGCIIEGSVNYPIQCSSSNGFCYILDDYNEIHVVPQQSINPSGLGRIGK